MKIKYENTDNEILCCFDDRGSNYEVFMEEASEEQFNEFIKMIAELGFELKDMELKDMVEVLINCVSKHNW